MAAVHAFRNTIAAFIALAAGVLTTPWTSHQAQSYRVSVMPAGVVVVAVSRFDALLDGGISGSRLNPAGIARVEPVASISSDGKWSAMPCEPGAGTGCKEFERSYLSQSRTYQVISQSGRGAVVHAAPANLGDCWEYSGGGTYSEGRIQATGLAASSAAPFDQAPDLHLLDATTAMDTLRAIAQTNASAGRVETGQRLLSIQLNGLDLLIVERSLQDGNESSVSGFGVFANDHGAWRQLLWYSDGPDQYVLGALKLKAGAEAIVTSVRDSESQSFDAYTIEHGRLVRLFSGGGASC